LHKVVFDSSFLMSVAEKPTTWKEDMTDLIGGIEPVILDCVKVELQRLADTGGRKGRAASVGLQLAQDFRMIKCGGATVDDEIISIALSEGAFVASNDEDLLDSLKAAGVEILRLRKGRVAVG
jgi:rRNA-processing protein FCF1